MKVAKLFGPKDLRVVDEPRPQAVGSEEVLIKVGAVGICGSDLHMYGTGAIAYTKIESPIVPVDELISETVSMEAAADAFARNYVYEPGVNKIIITPG